MHVGVLCDAGVVYGFNVSIPEHVSAVAKTKNVKVSLHRVIYKLVGDIKERLSERLLPLDVEEQIGELPFMLNESFKNCYSAKKLRRVLEIFCGAFQPC